MAQPGASMPWLRNADLRGHDVNFVITVYQYLAITINHQLVTCVFCEPKAGLQDIPLRILTAPFRSKDLGLIASDSLIRALACQPLNSSVTSDFEGPYMTLCSLIDGARVTKRTLLFAVKGQYAKL